MKKKLLALLLSFVAVFCFAGASCKDDQETSSPVEIDSSQESNEDSSNDDTDASGDKEDSAVVCTVTETKWEEIFSMSNITNARVSISNLSMPVSLETVEIEGENLRKLKTAERNGQMVGYAETIVTKEETYRYYYRVSSTDVFITGERSAEEYADYKAQEIIPYFDIVKALKDRFANASYDTTNEVYTVTIESFYEEYIGNISDAEYTISFKNGVLESVFCTLTVDEEIFSAEFVFREVSITVPTVA